MYAVTDGFSGLSASFGMEGTGHNFLVHNMCRLKGSGGTWMIAKGGMGAVSEALAEEARKAGATIRTEAEVLSMEQEAGGGVCRVRLASARQRPSWPVAIPIDLLIWWATRCPALFKRLRGVQRQGTTFKLNLALLTFRPSRASPSGWVNIKPPATCCRMNEMVRCLPKCVGPGTKWRPAGWLIFPRWSGISIRMRNPACRINMATILQRCLCNGFPTPWPHPVGTKNASVMPII